MLHTEFAFLGGFGLIEFFILGFVVVTLGLWLWALVDCLSANFTDSNQKIIWVLVIMFVGFLGPILYFSIGQKHKAPEQ